MIRICVKSSHCFFVERKVEQFKVIIDNVLITMESQNEILDMTLEGEVSREVIERLWADVFSVVYLYLGTYPRIISEQSGRACKLPEILSGLSGNLRIKREHP